MGDYLTAADHIEPLLGGRVLGESAICSEATVDTWIDQAERELIGTIAAAGGGTDYTGSTHATLIIREWISIYVMAKVEKSIGGAANDGANEAGQLALDGWRELLTAIRTNPIHFVNMLGASASQTIAGMRSHAVSTDEADATFKMTEKF